ncbi:unnamed protein product [Heterosigma akashiwo]
MEYTQVGSFNMKPSPGSSSKPGPPKIIQDLLAKFGSDREEDKLAGYLNFLKIGPKLLRFVPGKKVKDLRNWLEIYSYWNQGGYDNIKSMFLRIGQDYLDVESEGGVLAPGKLVETPAIGLIHPAAPGRVFATAGEYLAWHRRDAPRPAFGRRRWGGRRGRGSPMHASSMPLLLLLLCTSCLALFGQRYLGQLVDQLEAAGVLPLPIFINGVEAHTVVRDLLTSAHEQDQKRKGIHQISSLSKDAVEVDCIINTIGFPLVGGPAGSMEAGRRTDVAAAILGAKGLPYFVAGPLLVQDINSWRRSGVQGLQSVVLYSLPELDGAVDPVVLGGLAGRAGAAGAGEQAIALVRARRWLAGASRLGRPCATRPPTPRKVAILVYGFPPNCGAVGTAALMDVPRSLEQVLHALSKEGYDLGSDADKIDGEALIAALKVIAQPNAALRGVEGLQRAVEEACSYQGDATKLLRIDNPEGLAGATVCGQDILPGTLEKWLGKRLVSRMERQWGRLSRQTDLGVNRRGDFVVAGLQLGNVWLGVQPLLGLEGDPMRLMFERDLTPHPQYAAYYQWLARVCVWHGRRPWCTGMHGTGGVAAGSSLGGTFESWPDVLLGALPHLYVYAANNPSEVPAAAFDAYAADLWAYLLELENRLFSEGLHVLAPTREQALQYLLAYFDGAVPEEVLEKVVKLEPGQPEMAAASTPRVEAPRVARRWQPWCLDVGLEISKLVGFEKLGGGRPTGRHQQFLKAARWQARPSVAYTWVQSLGPTQVAVDVPAGTEKLLKLAQTILGADDTESPDPICLAAAWAVVTSGACPSRGTAARDGVYAMRVKLKEAIDIHQLLARNDEEIISLLKGLGGQYIPPGVGGDLLRDGAGVLPTGRNTHALDPYRMPGPAAARGRRPPTASSRPTCRQPAWTGGQYPPQ